MTSRPLALETLTLQFNASCSFSDLMHGRRIMRSLWEYYKVTGVIKTNFSALELSAKTDTSSETSKDLGFSLIRLRNISEQRQIFSSLESLSSNSSFGSSKDDITKPNEAEHQETGPKLRDNSPSERNQHFLFNENIRLRDISSWKDDYNEKNKGLDSYHVIPNSTSRMLSEDVRAISVPRLAVIGTPLNTGHESPDLALATERGPNMDKIEWESLKANSRPGIQPNMGPQNGFMQISSLGVGPLSDPMTVPSHEQILGELQYKCVGGGGKVVTTSKGSNLKKSMITKQDRKNQLDIYIKPISLQKAERTDLEEPNKSGLRRKRSKRRKKPSKAFHPDIIVSDTQ